MNDSEDGKQNTRPERHRISRSPVDRLKDLTVTELIKDLESSPDGLSGAEAQNRLTEYGYNELPEKKVNPVLKFLSYFWGPIPAMIIIAAILSAVLKHWPDLGIILVLLIMNAVVGFREEYQAGNTIEALKERLAIQARVKRDGQWNQIPASHFRQLSSLT